MPEEGQDFARLSVAAEGFLREKHFVVHCEYKDTFGAGDEREPLDHVLIVAHDFVHHTGGARPVVSGNAVFEGDNVLFHGFALWPQW